MSYLLVAIALCMEFILRDSLTAGLKFCFHIVLLGFHALCNLPPLPQTGPPLCVSYNVACKQQEEFFLRQFDEAKRKRKKPM